MLKREIRIKQAVDGEESEKEEGAGEGAMRGNENPDGPEKVSCGNL